MSQGRGRFLRCGVGEIARLDGAGEPGLRQYFRPLVVALFLREIEPVADDAVLRRGKSALVRRDLGGGNR